MSAGSMFGVLGALLTAAESALGAKVRVRVEQDLLPVYVAVSDAGGTCGHRHKALAAAERCAQARGRRGGSWVAQAASQGPRLRWGVSSRG